MSMTLEQVRQLKDRLRELADRDAPVLNLPETFTRWADIVDANLAQPAQSVDVAGAIRKGFMTAESCGPDNRYVLSIKFGSLDDLQAAHNALVGLTAALQEKGNGSL